MKSRILKHLASAALITAAPLALAANPGLDREIRQQGEAALAAMQADLPGSINGQAAAQAVLSEALGTTPAAGSPSASARNEPCAPGRESRPWQDVLPEWPRLPSVSAPLVLRLH